MKLLHIADTHLGFSAYRKIDDETGLNQREMDIYNSFEQFVDSALKLGPDVILHAGDLFDSVRPTNRTISFAIGQILRLTKEGIPFVVISGNHETPRLRETGSVFRVLEYLDNIFPVYKGRYESIELDGLKIHCIPHCIEGTVDENLSKLKVDRAFDYNVGLMHAGVVGISVFRTNEFNEQLVSSGYLRKEFDYIALGHYHCHTRIEDNAFYAGSTERFSFNEVGEEKGFIEVELDEKRVQFHPLKIREMIDLEPIDCSELSLEDIMDEIKDAILGCEPKDKIVRLRILNIPSHIYPSIDFNAIRRMSSESLNFEIKYEVRREEQSVVSGHSFSSLSIEFKEFIEKYSVEGLNKGRLRELGLDYIRRVEEMI